MTDKQKASRKKAYKFMSVSELVTTRKELASKIEQIDVILNQAVQAVGQTTTLKNRHITMSKQNIDPAFVPANYSVDQVPVSKEAPVLSPIARTAADQSSGFSIFDAESAAKEQAYVEAQYLKSNSTDSIEDAYDFNSDEVSNEIESLKANIKSTLEKDV